MIFNRPYILPYILEKNSGHPNLGWPFVGIIRLCDQLGGY